MDQHGMSRKMKNPIGGENDQCSRRHPDYASDDMPHTSTQPRVEPHALTCEPGAGPVRSHSSRYPAPSLLNMAPTIMAPAIKRWPSISQNRMGEPGRGLEDSERRVLRYTDLKSLEPYPDQRGPERQIEFILPAIWNRFMWSFDGKKYSEAKEPIPSAMASGAPDLCERHHDGASAPSAWHVDAPGKRRGQVLAA